MDSKDRQIITELQKDGRITNQELSERVNLSPSPCLRRLRLLEEGGVIKGYAAIVDEETYGLPITAFVSIRLQQHTQDVVQSFERKIRDMDTVLDCYVMTGNNDYLLRILVRSLKEYEDIVRSQLHNIPGIAAIDTSFAYSTVKRSTVFPRFD